MNACPRCSKMAVGVGEAIRGTGDSVLACRQCGCALHFDERPLSGLALEAAVMLFAWLVLMVLAWRRPIAQWRGALPLAMGVAVVAAVIGFVLVPMATRSSLQELAYWVDWANLASIALGIGAAALAFAWPLGVLRRRNIIN